MRLLACQFGGRLELLVELSGGCHADTASDGGRAGGKRQLGPSAHGWAGRRAPCEPMANRNEQ